MAKRYTTPQFARAVGVSRATIQYWISSGKINAPAVQLVKGVAVRLWTLHDLKAARGLKATMKKGPKPK